MGNLGADERSCRVCRWFRLGAPSMSDANGSHAWADKKIFTTGEAAEICKVSQQTIIR